MPEVLLQAAIDACEEWAGQVAELLDAAEDENVRAALETAVDEFTSAGAWLHRAASTGLVARIPATPHPAPSHINHDDGRHRVGHHTSPQTTQERQSRPATETPTPTHSSPPTAPRTAWRRSRRWPPATATRSRLPSGRRWPKWTCPAATWCSRTGFPPVPCWTTPRPACSPRR